MGKEWQNKVVGIIIVICVIRLIKISKCYCYLNFLDCDNLMFSHGPLQNLNIKKHALEIKRKYSAHEASSLVLLLVVLNFSCLEQNKKRDSKKISDQKNILFKKTSGNSPNWQYLLLLQI